MEDHPVRAPGYRFYPTEEELISFYLHNKLHGKIIDDLHRVIPDVHIYNFDPWQLPQVSGEVCNGDSEQWFFFTPRQDREARGGRPNRTTNSGYWKATGSPGYVYGNGNRVIGVKKTMVFYKGKAPTGRKTKWKMNEYKAIDHEAGVMQSNNNNNVASSSSTAVPLIRHEFSICRIYVKSGCLRAFDRRPSEATHSTSGTTAETTIHRETHGGVGGGTSTTSTASEVLVDRKTDSPNCDISSSGDDVPPHGQSVELGGGATSIGNWDMDDFQHPLWGWEQLNWD